MLLNHHLDRKFFVKNKCFYLIRWKRYTFFSANVDDLLSISFAKALVIPFRRKSAKCKFYKFADICVILSIELERLVYGLRKNAKRVLIPLEYKSIFSFSRSISLAYNLVPLSIRMLRKYKPFNAKVPLLNLIATFRKIEFTTTYLLSRVL